MNINESLLLYDKQLKNLYDLFLSNDAYSDLHLKTNSYPSFRNYSEIKTITDFGIITDEFMKYIVAKIYVEKYGNNSNSKESLNLFLQNGKEEDFSINLLNSEFRARLNIAKSLGDIKITYRKIPNKMPHLYSLGLDEQHLNIIKRILGFKEGLVLITGQTGSGKSTTLAAIINEINENQNKHIVTIEHPVEFRHKDIKSIITHREVGEKSDTNSFSDGLRAAVRQDPDIILVGEMRDAETALAALQAAQTGHLVFATLHTNSAPETILRVLDLFPAEKAKTIRVSLGESLKLIISQKLVPSKDNKRVLAYECLYVNNTVKNAIIQEEKSTVASITSEMNAKLKEGMITMNRYLLKLFQNNQIEEAKALEYSNNKEELEEFLKD